MTTTKKFRAGALLLALSAAVGSGAAQAAVSQTQNWNGGSEGAKDVSWAVVKQSEFSFTVTPADISSVDSGGIVNHGGATTGLGTWLNGGGVTALSADEQPPRSLSISPTVYASGDKGNDAGGREYLVLTFSTLPDKKLVRWDMEGDTYTNRDAINPADKGTIGAEVVRRDGTGDDIRVAGLDKVNSSKFVLHLTAKQNTP